MSELSVSPNLVNVVMRSDNIVVTPVVANASSSLALNIGTTALAAFTGTAANEKFVVVYKCPRDLELVVNLAAATTTLAIYRNGTLVNQTANITGFQSVGTLAANTTYVMTVTSSVLVAAAALLATISGRQTFTFNTSFTSNSPRVINGMTVTTNPVNGTPIYNFNNASITMNSVGKAELDIYYGALGSNSLSVTTTSNSSGNSLATIFPSSSFPTQNFTVNDNVALVLTGMSNFTYTGLNGTLSINIPNLGIAAFVYTANVPYVGPIDSITPFSLPSYSTYSSAVDTFVRRHKTSICEMDYNEDRESALAIKGKEEFSILQ